uniref:Aminopeptidase n=1 Tax=Amphiprion ocellaris TaxID=80972 RepID=A0AAQ5YVD5_AMPOC
MAKGFFISKAVGIVCIVAAVGAVATIIALSVVYSQEKAKNNDSNLQPTKPPPVTKPPGPTTAKPSNELWDKYRLPSNLVPWHYNVTLRPRLTPDASGKYIFTGESSVEFHCAEATNLILIHSHKLTYSPVSNGLLARLTAVNGDTVPGIESVWLQNETQYLVVQLKGDLTKGNYYILETIFEGELADDLGGFYRSEYIENGVTKVIATTQMQPTDARKSFPCFDEPAMKATFDITLIHDLGTVALSNGTKQIPVDGVTVLETKFERTERMSTYLLAFIVSEFGFIQDNSDDLLVRIFARKPAIAAGQGDYALNKTGPIMKFFEEYYNYSYPLPKSDQIALPDFNAGAMENWGLITYRETALLYDEEYSSNSNKERIATIIAHELAHMWFGNLVTLRWWNDLWLNEGFASYVEYLGAHEAEPTWNVKDLIVLKDVHRVFAVDALASSHPLSSKEEDIQKPAQISELFDAISYSKGASVLRMLSDFLTEDVFKQGLQTYLKAFAFQNTSLQKNIYCSSYCIVSSCFLLPQAVDATGTALPQSVNNIMNTWVLQMGFPVVTINTATGDVSQKHFLLDPESVVTTPSPYNYEWIVPMRWMKTGAVQGLTWLETKSAMKVTGNDWVLANIDVAGYYRVNYDQANWDKLLNALNTNHEVIPVINRAQLVDDAFNLARAKIIQTVQALETTTYLNNETAYMPWASAINNLDYFYLMFDRSEVYGPMQDYLRKQVTPLFNYYKDLTVNWADMNTVCTTMLDQSRLLFSPFRIHPNLRSTVYCNAIAAGGAAEWEFAWDQFQNASIATEAEKIRVALACTKQAWLLNRYLEYTLNPELIRKQDATSSIIYIANNVIGQSLAWDFVRARWSYIFNQYGGGSFSFSNLINGVTERFSTEFELQQLKQFKADNAEVGFGSGTLALDQSIERTVANIKWIAENKNNVLNWFIAESKS